MWVPYKTGIEFAVRRKDWVLHQLARQPAAIIGGGARIGKAHSLEVIINPGRKRVYSKISQTSVKVISPWPLEHPKTIAAITSAGERTLAAEARVLLPQRLSVLAAQYNYEYKEVKIKKLTSRWGSCGSDGAITLSYYLVQLPWHLIDYVILHELAHTRHLNHSQEFWSHLSEYLPDAKRLRKEIKAFRPALVPADRP